MMKQKIPMHNRGLTPVSSKISQADVALLIILSASLLVALIIGYSIVQIRRPTQIQREALEGVGFHGFKNCETARPTGEKALRQLKYI